MDSNHHLSLYRRLLYSSSCSYLTIELTSQTLNYDLRGGVSNLSATRLRTCLHSLSSISSNNAYIVKAYSNEQAFMVLDLDQTFYLLIIPKVQPTLYQGIHLGQRELQDTAKIFQCSFVWHQQSEDHKLLRQ